MIYLKVGYWFYIKITVLDCSPPLSGVRPPAQVPEGQFEFTIEGVVRPLAAGLDRPHT